MGLSFSKVGIVGGTGGMGEWFANFLEKQGYDVYPVGRSTELTPKMMARLCDVVVISVPIPVTIQMIQTIGPFVKERRLLMDLTSIKQKPLEAMLAHTDAEVVGVHPLFGPVENAEGQRVAICQGRGNSGLKWVKKVFDTGKLKILEMEPKEHDRLMGLIQGVNHFSTLGLAHCIRSSGFSIDEIEKCSTSTFKRRLDRIYKLLEQPADLFGSLLIDNPESLNYIRLYRDVLNEMIPIIENKDHDAFQKLFYSLRGE
ncbi:MAG: prephenate dehydrogenase [Candidatus Magnetoglobus multicellularis str. Araruama]|uniref:Prephenate dehydrogenase n=1 Tax=Candidatus Magnetoglobus multicellularis str. Araruama TaxID=890399 RepID=A0A1V1PHN8_9BACT|nr:MAG: prephenate dehydrogenase [Candidatus Magnetoglobus multicellularis str. Araruama]